MNCQGLRVAAHTPDLDVDDSTTSQLQSLFCARKSRDAFIKTNWRCHLRLQLRMIDKIEPYFNGGLLLELKGGEKIEVSRRQTVKFKEMMSL